jgi:hypothetical protein
MTTERVATVAVGRVAVVAFFSRLDDIVAAYRRIGKNDRVHALAAQPIARLARRANAARFTALLPFLYASVAAECSRRPLHCADRGTSITIHIVAVIALLADLKDSVSAARLPLEGTEGRASVAVCGIAVVAIFTRRQCSVAASWNALDCADCGASVVVCVVPVVALFAVLENVISAARRLLNGTSRGTSITIHVVAVIALLSDVEHPITASRGAAGAPEFSAAERVAAVIVERIAVVALLAQVWLNNTISTAARRRGRGTAGTRA